MTWRKIPGSELVRQGLADLAAGIETIPALLVSIGSPRLRSLGIEIEGDVFSQPEHRLYLRLAVEDPRRAHSRYNALLRRLVSFERCVS